jgi:ABC-type transport system substrate-binding protein
LRIGMTASDIPLTTGQTDNGGEGQRFLGFTAYDALVNWDLTSATKPSDLVPGLAVSWGVDATDKTKWIFKLRDGVKFHDGSLLTADAIVWNLDKLLVKESPQFDPRQSAQGRSRIPSVATYRAIDALTLEITTKNPDATLPYQLAWIMISSAVPSMPASGWWIMIRELGSARRFPLAPAVSSTAPIEAHCPMQ